MTDVAELVFTALGEASMCWKERPKGEFDSVRAKEIGNRLIEAIRTGTDPHFAPLTPTDEKELLGKTDMLDEERAEKPATKLDHLLSKLRVYASDVNYLMDRMQQESLATIDEHMEVQAEIHELQRILADCDAYVCMSIGKFMLERWLRGIYMNQGVRREY